MWAADDGGREAAGFAGHAGDCVVRAIAIVCTMPYAEVYRALHGAARRRQAPPLDADQVERIKTAGAWRGGHAILVSGHYNAVSLKLLK